MSVFIQTGKASFYGPNGGGRDSYIYSNNGGFTIHNQPSVQPPIGSFCSPQKTGAGVSMKRPLLNSKSIHYHGNGSGRDSYIMVNQGGLMSENSPGSHKATFYNSLRTYERIAVKQHSRYNSLVVDSQNSTMDGSPKKSSLSPFRDHFMEGQVQNHSKAQRNQINNFSTYQKSMNSRLSQPKQKSPTRDLNDVQVNLDSTFTKTQQKGGSKLGGFRGSATLAFVSKRASAAL